MSLVRRAKGRILRAVRRGREVAWAPEWMNLGNLLYLGLWTHEKPHGRNRRLVLLHPSKHESLDLFPELRMHRFVRHDGVSFWDQRLEPWRNASDETDRFEHPLLASYVQTMLLPGSGIQRRPAYMTSNTMVVNVRRGDYFSVAQHQAEFGMNTAAYTLEAVRRAVADEGSPSRIVVISDSLEWCRQNLNELEEVAAVDFREGGPSEDLVALVHAPRLVITNSTFSYWGGYIGDVIQPGRQVIAPWLFSRNLHGGRAHQLRSSWTVIDKIPGGWDATC